MGLTSFSVLHQVSTRFCGHKGECIPCKHDEQTIGLHMGMLLPTTNNSKRTNGNTYTINGSSQLSAPYNHSQQTTGLPTVMLLPTTNDNNRTNGTSYTMTGSSPLYVPYNHSEQTTLTTHCYAITHNKRQ
jgi:hypothetical protein